MHGDSVSNLWLVHVCYTDKEQPDVSSVKSYNEPSMHMHEQIRQLYISAERLPIYRYRDMKRSC